MGFIPKHANTSKIVNLKAAAKRSGKYKGKHDSGVKKGAKGRGTKIGRDVFGPGDLDRWG